MSYKPSHLPIDSEVVVQDGGACKGPIEVVVRVLCHIDGRGLIADGKELHVQLVRVGQIIYNRNIDSSREALVAVRAGHCAHEHRVGKRLQVEDASVPAKGAAVQGVIAVVLGELVFLAAQLEFTVCNPVGHAADHGAKVRGGAILHWQCKL